MSDNTIYFANKPTDERAGIILSKSKEWCQSLDTSGYFSKLRTMWAAYHGAYYSDESHTISFSGEQGELVQIAVNHLRNIAQNIINMVTATRPSMECRAVNNDYKSIIQTRLGNSLLDYYMRDHRLEEYLKTAVEYSVVLGSGYIKLEWNATAGEVYDINEELGGIEIREGDLEFTNLSPFDVFFDTNRENKRHDWVICRSFKNRFDLAAKYPEYREKILSLPTKNELERFASFSFHADETDLIPIYEFYHKRTEAVPDGLYHLLLSHDITLIDSPMPYRNLPVYSIMPSQYLGTPYGYTPMFDLIPIQDALNSLHSTILTNQTAFGVQNILVPQGANLTVTEISGGLNIIEANQAAGEIKPLNLTQTPKEIFDYLAILQSQMEIISGVNPVTRGNPPPSLHSGTALALVQSMSLQFMSGLQGSYVALVEDLGTGIINTLKDHASVPRVAAIVGKNNRTELKEFTGESLTSINRVIVDIGNPLARTTAGRVEIAAQLLQMGAVTTAEQYFSVLDTGQLEDLTEDTLSQLYLIKSENERMVEGGDVIALMQDQHAMHIKEHSTVLSDPDLRFNPELVKLVTEHIQEHIDLLTTTNPNLLQILGQQPLMQQQGLPPQQNQQMQAPQDQMSEAMVPGPIQIPTNVAQTGMIPQDLPPMPNLPNGTQLPNPELQAQNMAALAALQGQR